MSKIVRLNDYRSKRYVQLASAAGWAVKPHSTEPMANVWIYSVDATGRIRAAGQLLQSAVKELRGGRRKVKVQKKDIQLAGSAVALLEEKPDDAEAQGIALAALAHYFSRTKHWQLVPSDAVKNGVHQIVVDWPAPGAEPGHILRPVVALQPGIMSPPHVQLCVEQVLAAERVSHPERLPEHLRHGGAR